jgi:hypothetical protein
MRNIYLIVIVIYSLNTFGQFNPFLPVEISTFKTPDFRDRQKYILVYVGVSESKEVNQEILRKVLRKLPKDVFVKRAMVYNEAWTDSPENMILSESIKYGIATSLSITTLDSEEKSTLRLIGKDIFLTRYNDSKYECLLQYSVTKLPLWRAVSSRTSNGCPTEKFIKTGIKEGVL